MLFITAVNNLLNIHSTKAWCVYLSKRWTLALRVHIKRLVTH